MEQKAGELNSTNNVLKRITVLPGGMCQAEYTHRQILMASHTQRPAGSQGLNDLSNGEGDRNHTND